MSQGIPTDQIAWARDRVELYPDKAVQEIERLRKLVLEKATEIGRLRATLRRIELLSQSYTSKNGIEIKRMTTAALDGSVLRWLRE